jgi:NAD-dependent deacetylase
VSDVAAHTPIHTPVWTYGVRRLVVLSGAGISTDSGIKDFRGASGAWTLNPAAQHRNTYRGFLADPELRAGYWRSRYEHPWHAEPNAGHVAVAALTNSDIDTTVVTQNTDGLHQRAGTPPDRVVELHGTMHVVMCVECQHRSPTSDVIARIAAGEAVPPCPQCGGILKTASTMFGQTMPPEIHARAEQAVLDCDLLLAVGTTLTVEPGGSLAASAVRAGATLVIANWDPTPYDGIATEIIRDPLSESLPRIAQQLLAGAAHADARPVRESSVEAGGSRPGPRPGQLLRAEARTARFRSRDADVERLMTWCAGVGVRTHLVWGPAGIGKSRLALELADRLATTGEWDVEFLARDATLPASGRRPLLTVVEDAETRQEQVARIMRAAGDGSLPGPVRVLFLARIRDGWEPYRSDIHTDAPLAASVDSPAEHADAVAHAVDNYTASLANLEFPGTATDPAAVVERTDPQDPPGVLQASVLAALLGGGTDPTSDTLISHELAYLHRASAEHALTLAAGSVAAAAATVILCGAADEEAALASLSHIPELEDVDIRIRAARWLRDMYPPAGSGSSPFWDDSLPAALAEDLVASVVTPRFLLKMLTETTEEQDRRTLTVLARAAATRSGVRTCLIELLSVLPGLSPAAVDAALTGGHPAPLAAALISLARNAALPAELLDAVPAGTTMFGEFPVLLAESLVEAYEGRCATYPDSAPRGLARMLIALAERLADLGQAERALAAAQRAVEVAEGLAEKLDIPARAASSLRRAEELTRREQ